ncbi:6-phospho-beta-glucosidase [Xanthomonas pisi]|uniref:6-phospho-beta-glucosidase n=1 Tax=Xanthomonas pisi TaxID=56457 RepID=A0A2S7D0S6_9XANT|nr:6-phospho-beta-glucosidase [Xanthomonas pisi]KLD69349.1 beta glucosidase [Xanthomonas pisi DSM 18956]PPU67400.1 6-phospho-beta-glucosidase [Xanthomonas pisi]
MSSSVDNRKLTLIGGGGVRTPLVVYGVNEAAEALGAREIVLYDPDQERLALMVAMGRAIVAEAGGSLQVHAAPSLEAAIEGAHFVLNSIRIGGIAQRAADEQTIIGHGYSGQETTGPGGVAKALRTVPVAIEQARMIERLSPDAWLVSFTNPAGLVTQAITAHTRARVVGICDTPVELFHNIARALGEPASDVECDYVGLNHLGWIRAVRLRGQDIMDRILGDDAILRQLYLAPLFDVQMLRALRLIPTEYLYFFYERRRALDNQRASGASRGGEIERLNRSLIGDLGSRLQAGDTAGAVQTYAAYLAQRSGSYMKLEAEAGSAFAPDMAPQPDPFRASTGYHRIAVDVMSALTGARPGRHVVNVRNRGAMAELADDDVVEIAADIDRDRIVPIPAAPLPDAVHGLVRAFKAYEHAAIEAALSGSHRDACKAMLIHPAIGEWSPSQRLLDALFGHDHDDGHCAGPAHWRGHAAG